MKSFDVTGSRGLWTAPYLRVWRDRAGPGSSLHVRSAAQRTLVSSFSQRVPWRRVAQPPCWPSESLYSVLCTLYSVLCTLYSVLCTLFSVLCTLYSVLCSLYSVLCTLYSVQHRGAHRQGRRAPTPRPNRWQWQWHSADGKHTTQFSECLDDTIQ